MRYAVVPSMIFSPKSTYFSNKSIVLPQQIKRTKGGLGGWYASIVCVLYICLCILVFVFDKDTTPSCREEKAVISSLSHASLSSLLCRAALTASHQSILQQKRISITNMRRSEVALSDKLLTVYTASFAQTVFTVAQMPLYILLYGQSA